MSCSACNGTGFGPCQDHLEACEACGEYADGIDAILANKDAEIQRLREALTILGGLQILTVHEHASGVLRYTVGWPRTWDQLEKVDPAAFAREALEAK